MCVYVLRITKEQAGKLAFHSHISCQQDNNGNKVMAILKSQARSQTEAPCRMLYVWLCAFIHSCTQAHCGHIRVKLISIPQETSGEFQLGWCHSEGYMWSGSLKKNDISLKLVANANAYQMVPVTTFTESNIPDSTAFSERDQLRLVNVHYRSLYESVPGVEIHSKDFRIFLGFWTAHSGLTGLTVM